MISHLRLYVRLILLLGVYICVNSLYLYILSSSEMMKLVNSNVTLPCFLCVVSNTYQSSLV